MQFVVKEDIPFGHKVAIKDIGKRENNGSFVLKDICLVAGLGGIPGKGSYKLRDGNYEYYISEPVVDDDAKGVAPFLLAFTESYRNGGKDK